jgi:hypothetical protein
MMADASSTLQIELVGWRNKRGQFAAVPDTARTAMQEELRSQSPALVALAHKLSPTGKREPWDKQTVRFADSWRATTTQDAQGATLILENTDPKAPFVIFPTRPHPIAAQHARKGGGPGLLRFRGKDGSVVFRHAVKHPGTAGNDVPSKVADAYEPDAAAALSRIAARVVASVVEAFSE